MNTFTFFVAIDLRRGQVVRLREGDPGRQTVYASDPAGMARKWLEKGAKWLHVVNLDGAFGSEDEENNKAIRGIVEEAGRAGAKVQFGGGLRNLRSIEDAINLGIQRVVIGTMAVEQPKVLPSLIERFGDERIAVSLDGREGKVMVRGWMERTEIDLFELAKELEQVGLRWVVFTDIARDGMEMGVNLEKTQALAQLCKLKVIASGGINSLADLENLEKAGVAGAIIGRALYEGSINADMILRRWSGERGQQNVS